MRARARPRSADDRVAQGTPLPVSVVIPAFKNESTIGRALESIRAQTCPPSETIVVIDGGTDRSAAIASAAGARVVRQENLGTGAARNAGIRSATQPWIAFVDADDEWFPHKLETI